MDWMNRGAQNGAAAGQPAGTTATAPAGRGKRSRGDKMRFASVGLLFCGAILILALIALTVLGGPATESKKLDKSKLQAVFLNGGQVYFGNIKTLNDKYLSMDNIYYLRVNQTVQPNQANNSSSSNDVSLVKLGCELHGPQDSMVINQSQVIFWENLKSDGQVAKAVAEYVKQNPNGQKCDTGTTSNSTTPTTDTTKKP
jgi:hypothetical protein